MGSRRGIVPKEHRPVNFGRDSKSWPTGSLERTLALANSKTLKEAVQKKVNTKQEETASQTMKKNEEYEIMRKTIKEIESLIGTMDIDTLDMRIREKLALMPLRTSEEVKAWSEAWREVLGAGGRLDSGITQEEIDSF